MFRRNPIILVASTLFFFACNSNKSQNDNWKEIYKTAYTNNDYMTGVVALNHLILTDTANKAEYIDSLAYYYTKKLKNFNAGSKYVDKGLALNPNNIQLLEYKSIFLGAESKSDESMETIQKAYKLSGMNKHKYMYAAIAFAKDNNLESYVNTINGILYGNSKPEVVEVNVDQNTTQIIDLRASCYMDKAKIALNTENVNETSVKVALNFLDSALKLAPEYQEALYYKEKIMSGK